MSQNDKYRRTRVFIGVGASSANDLLDALGQKQELSHKVLNDWRNLQLDALICPVFPFPAPPLDNPRFLPGSYLICLKYQALLIQNII